VALSDIELVARTLQDDHDAFAELVCRYQSPLRAWLRRLTDVDYARADDLAQETFLRAYRHLNRFQETGKFSTWLFAIAYNEFRNANRRGHNFIQLDDGIVEELPAEEDGNAALEASLDLDVAIQSLSINQRAAITLCYQQGMTHEEAAAVLKCPVGTVKTNILRGKERLRRFFCVAESVN
jgi:RNA polymerase sigma-70 factor (ECF subfamily)